MSKISILTSTYNSEGHIRNLIDSLISQSCYDFEWIISDGESTDSTLSLINSYSYAFPVKISSREDFGIYDSLNKGLSLVNTDFYLVIGSDDILFKDAIKQILEFIKINPLGDIYSFSIEVEGKIIAPQRKSVLFYGMRGISSSHSVGMVIRNDLHQQLGYYSKKFPLCADQYFVLLAYKRGFRFLYERSIITGAYCTEGSSGVDFLGTLSETYRIQIMLFRNFFFQTIIYFMRILYNVNKLSK
jgi:glycosyltransferase involved in cell wall biosynthesis